MVRRQPELIAAAVNGLLVLLAPVLFLALWAMAGDSYTDTSTTVRAPAQAMDRLKTAGRTSAVVAPFALVAAWRTWVHARRRKAGRGNGSRGIVEAGAVALGITLVTLAPGIVTRPLDAPPYVIVYGGVATIMGLLVGLVLWAAALLVLKLLGGR